MIIVTKEIWDKIPNDYKGIWERWLKDGGWQPDLPEEYIGKRTVMSGCISGEIGSLLTEGVHFVIKGELRNSLPTMIVWMAKKAVMEGVRFYNKAQKERDIQEQNKAEGKDYNFRLAHAYSSGVDVASEVLWKLFYCCSMDCKNAIEKVAKDRDGNWDHPDDYFDDFVDALESVIGSPVSIRVEE